MTPNNWRIAILAVVAMMFAPVPVVAQCCLCLGPPPTLTEELADAELVIVVRRNGSVWLRDADPESLPHHEYIETEYEIVEIIRQPLVPRDLLLDERDLEAIHVADKLRAGLKLQVKTLHDKKQNRPEKSDALLLLMGSVDEAREISWVTKVPTKAAIDYVKDMPSAEQPAAARLAYSLNFIECTDTVIADDAFNELNRIPYSDLIPLAKELPPDRFRQWLTDRDYGLRYEVYGTILGICGTDEDAELLEQIILDRKYARDADSFRLGISGVMNGYLLLTRERGLDVLDEKKLQVTEAPFSETYAAMQSLRFMWTHGDNRISQDRLRQSMRILLDRPELADLVIADLARMKDWSVQDQVIALYDADEYKNPSIKRAIVRFTIAASKDMGAKETEQVDGTDDSEETERTESESEEIETESKEPLVEMPMEDLPPHVIKAQQCLQELKKRDPKTFKDASRFFGF